MKKLIILCFVLVFALAFGVTASTAQTTQVSTNPGSGGPPVLTDAEILLMRGDMRSEKKKLIAMNITFTEQEATKFWPVYDQYAEEMRKVNDEFYKTVMDYATNNSAWTEAQAAAMLTKWSQLQVDQAKTRQKYVPLVEKVISARKAALFFQIDRRLYALMDLQTSAFLPLAIK
jgi:Spy/CpxP family protein refolding chaperone